jgi:hypothetical protein
MVQGWPVLPLLSTAKFDCTMFNINW